MEKKISEERLLFLKEKAIELNISECGNSWKDNTPIQCHLDKDGYFITSHKSVKYKVHQLVAARYVENKELKRTVDHIDSDKSNNHKDNFQWLSHSENARKSWSDGLGKPNRGSDHGRAILDDIKVLTMRTFPYSRNGTSGTSHRVFSDLYGVSNTRISNVRKGSEWTHLPMVNDDAQPFRI